MDGTVECVYFARIYCSRMANQNWAKSSDDRRRQIPEKHSKYTKKGLKTVKIINIEIFAIMYLWRMEFKSRKIDTREKKHVLQ